MFPSHDHLREYALSVEQSTAAQAEAQRQLNETRSAIEEQIRAEELRADMLLANADLAQSAFDTLRESFVNTASDAFIQIGRRVQDFAQSLTFSNISPVSLLDQFGQAQSEFNRLLQAARGGDETAANQLTGAAQTLLNLNAQINRSGVAGSELFQSVQDQLSSIGGGLVNRGERLSAGEQAQVSRLERLLGVSSDGFGNVRAAILESIQAAIANGQTFEQYINANAGVFQALAGQDFNFTEFARQSFEEAAASFALSEERRAQIEAAETALARASETLDALLNSGPGIEARFNDLVSSLQNGNLQIEDALAALSASISGAAAEFDARVEDVLVNDIQPVVAEIRGLRNDTVQAADRSARIGAQTLDAIERNFRSDQPVIVGGVRLQA